MADTKPSTKYYQLRGVNQKSSKYEFPQAEALALYNLDFDVPNAWSKRPGSTFAVGGTFGTSGPIQSLFEFSKLTGESYIVAGSDTALFYIAAGGLTLLSPGWNNGQPPDMLTFVNKLWAANGQNFASFDGSTYFTAGLPAQKTSLNYFNDANAGSGSFQLVGGATMIYSSVLSSASLVVRGVYLAYTYVRADGYQGAADFVHLARNLVGHKIPNGTDYFNPAYLTQYLQGFTAIGNAKTVNLWMATDTVTSSSATLAIPQDNGAGQTLPVLYRAGNLGYMVGSGGVNTMSSTLYPGADTSRFHFFTSVPVANLFLAPDVNGITSWSTTFIPGASFFDNFAGVAAGDGFSGMTFDFFATYTPKYIEIDQNIMFMSGFSSAPSTLWYSEVGEPETILPESNFEVRTDDGDRIYATKVFNNQLIVMKENSFHKVVGNNSDNFQLVEISTQYGCLSNKAVVQVKQSLYWLDKKGILEFNGASFDIISTEVEGIFRRMNISAAKEYACAVHHLYRNQIWFGIPIDGSTKNNITVVYDYLIGGWTFFDGFNPSSFGLIKGALNKPTVWRGSYSGHISYFGESFYSDNGQAISCVALTRFENIGGENQTTLWRRFFLDVGAATGVTGQIRCQFFSNYDTSTVLATFAMYQDQFQTRAEIGVNGKAAAAQISHSSASLPLLINGYAWATRGLRNV